MRRWHGADGCRARLTGCRCRRLPERRCCSVWTVPRGPRAGATPATLGPARTSLPGRSARPRPTPNRRSPTTPKAYPRWPTRCSSPPSAPAPTPHSSPRPSATEVRAPSRQWSPRRSTSTSAPTAGAVASWPQSRLPRRGAFQGKRSRQRGRKPDHREGPRSHGDGVPK